MNFKMILGTSLIVLLIVGIALYGYTIHRINTANPGTVTTQIVYLVSQLVVFVLQTAITGVIVYKT